MRTGDDRSARAVLVPPVTHFLKTDPRPFRGFTVIGANLDFFDGVTDHRGPGKLVAALDLQCDLLELISRSAWS